MNVCHADVCYAEVCHVDISSGGEVWKAQQLTDDRKKGV